MRNFLTTLFAMLCAWGLMAQSAPNFFNEIDESQVFLPFNAVTPTMPNNYITLQLDLPALRNYLRNAPAEGSADAKAGVFQLELPIHNGGTETFKVWESSVMHPDLAARYPMIRTFAGQSLEDPTHLVRFGFDETGFHSFIITDNGGSITTSYSTNQTQYYICFSRTELSWASVDMPPTFIQYEPMEGQPVADPAANFEGHEVELRGGGEGNLTVRRDYRFALACTGEFGQQFGTVSAALGKLVTAANTLNTVVERDGDFRLVLIPNNDELVFINPNTDPYTNANMGGALLGQNEDILNNIVGLQSFDIGHVYTWACNDVGGVVSGNVCSLGKGRGVTCNWSTDVVPGTLSIAAHEMGHQFTAGHTFANCPGQEDQYASGSAYEPGSGSTILSYQGACGSNNIPGPANVHYHGGTVEEFWICTHNTVGSICGITTTTSNHSPVVNHNYVDGFHIPISTPFELVASATDEDGDALTYAWEQVDLGPAVQIGQPVGSTPLFRVFNPTPNPMRVFPKLSTILSNGNDVTEVLPTYTRDLNFRCTVRDNNVDEGAGGITWKDVLFKSTASAGPFLVTNPNAGSVVWKSGEAVEVTWDVANTTNSLVNCQNVNIRLSTDGGQTFPHVLMVSTPNDGSEVVFVPNVTSNAARVRVEAADNIFFDLSNQNFTISPADEPGFALALNPQSQQVCVPSEAVISIQTSSILGFSEPVQFEILGGLPGGVDVTYVNNPATPGQSATINIDMSNVAADGIYEAQLQAIAGADTITTSLYFNVVFNDFSDLAILTPTDGQSSLGLLPNFTWTDLPQADAYDFQLSTSPAFGPDDIIDEGTNLGSASFTPDVSLEESTVYYWRIRPKNECGIGEYISTKAFQTFTTTCAPFSSTDVPKNIPAVGTPTITSTLTILQSGTISDLNVSKIKGEHDLVKHLRVTLISPAGTPVKLFENVCGNVAQFNLGLNDEAAFPIECPPVTGQSFLPQEALSAFDGEETIGDWTLKIEVTNPDGTGGTLENWSLEFCASVSPNNPYIVHNDTVYVKPLDTRTIFNFELAAEDIDNPGIELQFTIVDGTDHGFISKDGVQLGVGDHFTMTDIHLQKIAYTNTDADAVFDFFTFVVEDGTGGWVGTPSLPIVIDENAVVGVSTPESLENSILLAPNPASNALNVSFLRPLSSVGKATVLDVQGRVVASQNLPQDTRQLQLDLADYTSGVYFLNVATAEGVVAKKFVVQK